MFIITAVGIYDLEVHTGPCSMIQVMARAACYNAYRMQIKRMEENPLKGRIKLQEQQEQIHKMKKMIKFTTGYGTNFAE